MGHWKSHQLKALATKPYDLGSILGTLLMERENYESCLRPLHYTVTLKSTHTHKYINPKKFIESKIEVICISITIFRKAVMLQVVDTVLPKFWFFSWKLKFSHWHQLLSAVLLEVTGLTLFQFPEVSARYQSLKDFVAYVIHSFKWTRCSTEKSGS